MIENREKKNLKINFQSLLKCINSIIGKYERNETKPSIEVVIKIADELNISIDYLVGKTDIELDIKITKRIKKILKLPKDTKQHIFMVMDALIRDFKAKQAYNS